MLHFPISSQARITCFHSQLAFPWAPKFRAQFGVTARYVLAKLNTNKYTMPTRFCIQFILHMFQQGGIFTINSVSDLLDNINNLECIYDAGKAPNRVPLGLNYGTVLKISTSDIFAPFIESLWKGKLVSNIRCPNEINLGLNVVAGRLQIPALISIGKLTATSDWCKISHFGFKQLFCVVSVELQFSYFPNELLCWNSCLCSIRLIRSSYSIWYSI